MPHLVDDNYVWTRRGPKRVSRLRADDELLGIDEEGKPLWTVLGKAPSSGGNESDIVVLTLNYAEIGVGENCRVVRMVPTQEVEANKVVLGDQLETFSNRRFLVESYLASPPLTKREQLEHFFAGLCIRRNPGPCGTVVIRIPSRELERAAKTVRGAIAKLAEVNPRRVGSNILTEEGPLWSWIVVKSNEAERITAAFYSSDPEIPQKVEEGGLEAQKWFFKGMIEAMGVHSASTGVLRFVVAREESWLRRFFLHMAFLFGVEISISATPSYYPLQFRLESPADISLEELGNHAPASFSKVRGRIALSGAIYQLPSTRREWSPVVGNIPLAPD